ncbi:MAG: hypothetical protein LBD78_08920 [Spirochaetaceae bacterium]|jgi:hypothetical protein|nr:hypothetical protein [Spirochaetaceae bacterium]
MRDTFAKRGMRIFRMAAIGCLALAMTGGLFAQELKFDGYVNSGLGIVSTDKKVVDGDGTKTADSQVYAFGVNSEQPGYRFRLNGSYTNSDGNAGAKFRFQAQSKFDLGAFSLPYAYGWVSFLNSIFTVNGGLVDNGTWESGGALLNEDAGEGLGALLKISPVEGLDLGTGVYVISQQGGGDNSILKVPQGLAVENPARDFSKISIGLNRLKYTFNAAYTATDIFKATVSFRTKNQAGDEISRFADSADEVFTGREESSRMIVGLRLLAVKDLTAVVEADIDRLEDYGNKGVLNIYETIGYKLGNLRFGLNAAEYISRVEKSDLGLHFNPWLSYTIGLFVPRLDLNYFLADTQNAVGAKYHRKVFSYKSNGADTKDLSVFAIRPSVTFNIDSRTFVEIGDLIALENGPEGAFADAADPNKSSQFTNVFYIDFKWSF